MPRTATKTKEAAVETQPVKAKTARRKAIATTEPPIRVWGGVRMNGLVPEHTWGEAPCLFRRGRFAIHQYAVDWFEIFEEQSGNRCLSAIWDREMVDRYLDRLEAGEDSRRLQCEIDSNYAVLGGVTYAAANLRRIGTISTWMTPADRENDYQLERNRRLSIGNLYGDRRNSTRKSEEAADD